MTQALKTLEDTTPIQQDSPCSRCGILIPWQTIAKRLSRSNPEDRCRDCIPRDTVNRIQARGVKSECNPWAGDIDLDTLQPLKRDGSPHMPGIRTCGHADCVNRNHIINMADLEAERHDISYRTGDRRGYFELLAAVKKERHP